MPLFRPTAARVALVLLGALLLSVVAAAAPAHASNTRHFEVLNLSNKNLKLYAVDTVVGTERNAEFPPVNSVYIPGDRASFEMDNSGRLNNVIVRFIALDNAQQNVGTIAFRLYPNNSGVRFSNIDSSIGSVEGSTDGGGYMHVLDKRGTNVDASGWAPADQARVAGGLCRLKDDVTCKTVITTFPNRPDATFADQAQQTVYESNNGCSNLVHTWTIEKSLTVEHSWEVALAFSAGVKDIWSTELTAKYGGKSVDSTKVTDSITRTLLPGERGWVVYRLPVLRYRGDWTVTTPTTTIDFRNLPIDTGDPDRTRPESDYRSDAISPTGKITKPSQCP